MSKAATFVAFAVGAALGSIVTWQYTKKKYEQIANQAIEEVKERYSDKTKPDPDADIPSNPVEVDGQLSMMEYAAKLQKTGYTDYADISSDKPQKPIDDEDTIIGRVGEPGELPYVIPPEEFGEIGYEKISLTFYEQDQVLADDSDFVVDNVDDIVGFKALTCFGEYEDDSVHVRNDRLKRDFEILLDLGSYEETVAKKKPYKADA